MLKIIRFTLFPLLLLSSLILHECKKESKLPVDGDGNEYETIVIGTQVWLTENLKTTKYNNGVSIPLVTDNNQWVSTSSAAFCWYGNSPDFKEDYGVLYNWWAAKLPNLCPVGYRVPSREEWITLINYVGNSAGAKLKDRVIRFWLDYDDCETNEFGFKARPGGVRNPSDGQFYLIREEGVWWTSTESIYDGWIEGILIKDDFCEIDKDLSMRMTNGASIRCIKNK